MLPSEDSAKCRYRARATGGVAGIFAFLAGPAFAAGWTGADTEWQATYLVLHACDWGQTRNIAQNPDKFYELNPLLGEHPSVRRVDSYMLTSALVHTAITYALPPRWRRSFQKITVGFKGGLVGHNYSIGLRVDY